MTRFLLHLLKKLVFEHPCTTFYAACGNERLRRVGSLPLFPLRSSNAVDATLFLSSFFVLPGVLIFYSVHKRIHVSPILIPLEPEVAMRSTRSVTAHLMSQFLLVPRHEALLCDLFCGEMVSISLALTNFDLLSFRLLPALLLLFVVDLGQQV